MDQTERHGTPARLGVWLIGARGSVATTAMTGWRAVAEGLAAPTGLVTEAMPLADAPLPELRHLVFGGHDVATTPLIERSYALARAGVIPPELPERVGDFLDDTDVEIRPGIAAGAPDPLRQVRADLDDFRARHQLEHVVVVNVASTEPPPEQRLLDLPLDEMLTATAAGQVPPSVVYALAALDAGCGYVDFTPSAATQTRAVAELAGQRGLPFAGRDGKTGETLIKSALAPMFLDRALRVRSWAGSNLLGGGDGATLSNPDAVRSKLASKAGPIASILGPDVEAPVRIDYVADLGEWKTAWDHITFEGFLGTRMRMQFTWDGCDSTLAAPLVLDLARLTGAALAAGRTGPLAELAYFFKDPVGCDEHRLAQQFVVLCDWALGLEPRPAARRIAPVAS